MRIAMIEEPARQRCIISQYFIGRIEDLLYDSCEGPMAHDVDRVTDAIP